MNEGGAGVARQQHPSPPLSSLTPVDVIAQEHPHLVVVAGAPQARKDALQVAELAVEVAHDDDLGVGLDVHQGRAPQQRLPERSTLEVSHGGGAATPLCPVQRCGLPGGAAQPFELPLFQQKGVLARG